MISAPPAPSGLVETNFTTSSPNVSFGASLADAWAWLRVMLVAMMLAVADPRVEQNSEGGCALLPNLPPGRSASRRTATGWAPCVRGEQSGSASRGTATGWAPCVRGEQSGSASRRTATGWAPCVRGEQSGSASRRTATGWAPCVRGEQSGDHAGKAGARTAAITSHEVFSDRLSATSAGLSAPLLKPRLRKRWCGQTRRATPDHVERGCLRQAAEEAVARVLDQGRQAEAGDGGHGMERQSRGCAEPLERAAPLLGSGQLCLVGRHDLGAPAQFLGVGSQLIVDRPIVLHGIAAVGGVEVDQMNQEAGPLD